MWLPLFWSCNNNDQVPTASYNWLTQRYLVPCEQELLQQFLVVFIRCGTSLMKYISLVGSYIFLTL